MLSEKAIEDIRGKLAALQQAHGSLREAGKCDDAFRAAYPDHVDLHTWRTEWQYALIEERKAAAAAAAPPASDAPKRKGKGS